MTYMKRNVNLILLFLLIIMISSLVGLTTYYQTTFKVLSSNYKTKLAELEEITTNLQLEKSKLNQTYYQLQIKTERETDLSTKYSTLRKIKEQLETEKASLEDELATTKSELSHKKIELTNVQLQLSQIQLQLMKLEAELQTANDRITDLEEDLREAEIARNDWQSKYEDLVSQCGG
jgi:chromosome segregation ATPase